MRALKGGVGVLAFALVLAGPAAAQSPSPSPAPSPAPTFTLATRGEASDDHFRLTIETDTAQVTTNDAVDIRTTWASLGTEPVRICTGGGGPIIFVVEQLDGFFDPGGGGDDSGRVTTVQPGTVDVVPFQKSGGYNGSDPMAPQYAAWFDDPVLHLPAGTFRISADAEYGIDDCGPPATLEASVVIQVEDAPAESASPTPSPSLATTPTAVVQPPLSISNQTSMPVTLVVNGSVVETIAPGDEQDPIAVSLPARPWTIETRSPSGRLLSTLTVAATDIIGTTSGRAVRADLSCGRLDLWSGPPLLGPMFSPGPPGDCD